jgi:hypothetical protein
MEYRGNDIRYEVSIRIADEVATFAVNGEVMSAHQAFAWVLMAPWINASWTEPWWKLPT